jgi:hypothetical protein
MDKADLSNKKAIKVIFKKPSDIMKRCAKSGLEKCVLNDSQQWVHLSLGVEQLESHAEGDDELVGGYGWIK